MLGIRCKALWCRVAPSIIVRFHSSAIRLIEQYTNISRNHLAPEIQLRLITRQSIAWNQKVSPDSPHPLGEPYWAFFWPGGQALCRYILDYPSLVKGKNILDFGSGSGCCSIAALLSGAAKAVANDIDPMAIAASQVNASINGVHLEVCSDDLIGSSCDSFDVILVGDMLYDSEFAHLIGKWLIQLREHGKCVLVGDPGRANLNSLTSERWSRLAKYELDETTKQDNYGFNHAFVMTPI